MGQLRELIRQGTFVKGVQKNLLQIFYWQLDSPRRRLLARNTLRMHLPPHLDVRFRGPIKDMNQSSSDNSLSTRFHLFSASRSSLLSTPQCTSFLSLVLFFSILVNVSWPDHLALPLQYEGSTISTQPSPAHLHKLAKGAHPPYHVKLTPQNTAYQMILVGPPKRQVLAAITALQLRATDSERDILLQVKEPLTEPLMEVMEQLRVKVQQMEYHSMQQMEFDFGQCCSHFWACWMKLLTWNETGYKAVMNIDTDFLVLRNMGRAFEILGETSQTPFDVGGVADPIVASTHGDTTKFDVLNGGMFMALPGREAYELMVSHAHSHKWEWGEMLWLNTFAASWGHWVRLPLTFNIFPILLRPGSPYLHYSPTNWDSIYGLHFAGISKVWGDATRKDCEDRQTSDCVECCYKWVNAAGRLNELLSVNKEIAAGENDGNATLGRLLPSGWQDNARDIVLRNAARGYAFDKNAYHDGYTGGTWAEREAREALEKKERSGTTG